MADMQLRDKMKKISEAAKHGNRVPERSKNAGLVVFLVFTLCVIIVMLALAIGLMISKHFTGAAVICSIATLLTYSVYKMMKADNIGQL